MVNTAQDKLRELREHAEQVAAAPSPSTEQDLKNEATKPQPLDAALTAKLVDAEKRVGAATASRRESVTFTQAKTLGRVGLALTTVTERLSKVIAPADWTKLEGVVEEAHRVGYDEYKESKYRSLKEQQERDAKSKQTAAKSESKLNWRSYYSDMELAERFLATKPNVCFVSEYAEWRHYEDSTGVWAKVTEFAVRGLIQKFLEEEFNKAKKANDKNRLEQSDVCQRAMTGKKVLDWLTPKVELSTAVFDSDKDRIVVQNGVVDLRTSELLPFSPDYFFTRRIDVPFVKGAKNSYTDLAIESLPADAHHQFQVMAGQALTGYQPSRSTVFFLWGDGANGKSTLLDLLDTTAGGFGGTVPEEVLLKSGFKSNFHSIAFKGKRQVVIEELPDERFLDGGVIRKLAGSTTMAGEHKGKDVEEFEVLATIFITFNNRPQVTETAHGVWRRLKLFQFPFTYVEKESQVVDEFHKLQHPMLKDLHKKSADAVIAFLAWRIEGARLWYDAGRTDPEDSPSVIAATAQWRTSNDPIEHWYDENLVTDPGYFCLLDDLLDDFNQWRNIPRAMWGKHSLLDKFTSHSVFRENSLEYKQAARHSDLTQSLWASERAHRDARKQQRIEENVSGKKPSILELLDHREAKPRATYIAGVRFRSALDDLDVPDDASALDALGDEFDLEDEDGVTF